MQIQTLSGTRLREKRLSLGIKQADLAASAGISASYLNLIEHNRRRVAPEILSRLARALGADEAQFQEGAGSALVDDLRAAAADFAERGAEVERVEEFAGRYPGWAGLLAAVHQRGLGLDRAVEALNDRLGHDPHLSAALHEMLSVVSSVASTAAILAETPDIDPEWRDRFLVNLNTDGQRLSESAETLVAFLDTAASPQTADAVAPQQELESWLARRGWDLGAVETPEGRAALNTEIADLPGSAARKLAAEFLDRAAQDAARLPMARLAAAVGSHGLDPIRLAQALGVPVMQVFRQLALMPGGQAGLVLCDGSGALTFQRPVPGFAMPRLGSCCPLWPLFAALSRPMTPVAALVETPAARRFRVLAYCEVTSPEGFGGPELRTSAMLVLPPPPGPSAQGAPLRVGPTCRICPRAACAARREPAIVSLQE